MLRQRSSDPFVALAHTAVPISVTAAPPCAQDARVPYGSDAAPTPLLVPYRPSAAPATWLVRCSDGTERNVSRLLRIGSGPDNDWIIQDRFVSTLHLVMRPDSDGVLVEDRSSRNGTYINGIRIRHGELRPGGSLRIGQTELRLHAPAPSELLGESPQMHKLREQLQRFAPSSLPVLVLGESGTGKELVAKALHQQSGRRGPLITINCGALPKELIESELFGHERGAFTGADRRHPGCFAEASGGTLFLDELGELPIELQPRLLRVLENRMIRPVGASREIEVDVRIVAATHRDLAQSVQQGLFRHDLFYRLAGLRLDIPPLRHRPDDIVLLARHFVRQAATEWPALSMSDEELALLCDDDWPGNVRELKMAIVRAAHLYGPTLRAQDVLEHSARLRRQTDDVISVKGRRLADIERDILTTALRHAGGNQRLAAEQLALPKSSLSDRLRKLGIVTARQVVTDK